MKFARRKLLSKMIESFGKESVRNLRSYNLADEVSKSEPDSPRNGVSKLRFKAPKEAISRKRPKKPLS